jgi:hypothetical protein
LHDPMFGLEASILGFADRNSCTTSSDRLSMQSRNARFSAI